MKKIFADTFHWAALLNPKDQWHQSAKETQQKPGKVRLVTTETVLIELLNFFSEYGAEMRQIVVDTTRDILVDLEIEYFPHSPEVFLEALDFYENRLDKGYSLTDCISMLTMKNLGVQEILTHDNHFEQEGFAILL
ncbi:MAG: type II toxin-antitoxin system VapC family toxin [Pyrinomonadaceae bacterium]